LTRQDLGKIPIVETYRGIGIHDCQTAERISSIVKPEIDEVLDKINDLKQLFRLAGDTTKSPEARLLAAAKCEAAWQLAVEDRKERPYIDITVLRASVCALDSQYWRSTTSYCSALDVPVPPGQPGPAPRPRPLTDQERGR
jgi:hypothetical protein